MSTKSGLDIEGMSTPEIQKIVDDLVDKNKTLEYHLSLMKNCFEVFIKIFDKINHSISGEELRQLSALMSQFTDVYRKQSLESVQKSRIWPQIIQMSVQSNQTSDPLDCGSLPATEEVFKHSSDSQNEMIVEISDNSSDELDSSEEQNRNSIKIIELTTSVSPKAVTTESNVSSSEDLTQLKDNSNEELIVSHNTDSSDSIELIESVSAPLLKCRLCGQLYDINTDPKHMERHRNKTSVSNIKKNRVRNTSYYLSPLPSGSQQNHKNNVCVNDIEAEVRFRVDDHSITSNSTPMIDKVNGSVNKTTTESQSCLKSMLSSDIPSVIPTVDSITKSVFNCCQHLCGETFDEEMAFINHLKTVHNKRMKKCVYKQCLYFYEKRDDYWKHLKVDHKGQDPPFKCVLNSCGKSFWTNADLNRHINAFHSSDRHFKSDNNFQFNSTTLLMNSNPFKRIKFSSLVHPNGQLRQNQNK